MKKLTTLIIISNLFWFGELNAQFNVDWAYDYMHTTNANFSNEGRKVATDTIGDKVYSMKLLLMLAITLPMDLI